MHPFYCFALCCTLALIGGCSAPPRPSPTVETVRECDVIGVWQGIIPGGILMGQPVNLTFYDNGMARGISGNIVLDVGWQRQGTELSIVHQAAIPPAAGCPVEQVGRYALTFEGDCSGVVSQSVEDGCEHRRRTLDGLRARRQ